MFSKNKEKYWDCHKCQQINKTEFGGKVKPCDNCKSNTYSTRAELNPSEDEVIYGKGDFIVWVCPNSNCNNENFVDLFEFFFQSIPKRNKTN